MFVKPLFKAFVKLLIENIKRVIMIDTLICKLIVFKFCRLFHLNAHFTASFRK